MKLGNKGSNSKLENILVHKEKEASFHNCLSARIGQKKLMVQRKVLERKLQGASVVYIPEVERKS